MIEPNVLQPNLVPITLEDLNIQEGMDVEGTPVANTPTPPPADLNIQVSSNGSVMSIGNLQSTNFSVGASGWRLDSNGNIEANDGNFRGDISGATGTFTGTVSIGSLNIPDEVTADSFHVDTTGNAWWGATAIGSAVAKIEKDGSALFTSITATGTINATGGYLGASDTVINVGTSGLNVGITGHIRGGQTAYNTGTGWFLGYDTDAYKLSLGVSTGDYLLWDGINLTISTPIEAFHKFEAYENLDAGDLVSIINDGDTAKLMELFGYSDITVGFVIGAYNKVIHKAIKVDDNKIIVEYRAYNTAGGGPNDVEHYVRSATISGKTLSWGTAVNYKTTSTSDGATGAFIDMVATGRADFFALMFQDNTYSYGKASTKVYVCDASGTNIAVGVGDDMGWTVSDADASETFPGRGLCKVADDKIVAIAYDTTNTNEISVVGSIHPDGRYFDSKGAELIISSSQDATIKGYQLETDRILYTYGTTGNTVSVSTNTQSSDGTDTLPGTGSHIFRAYDDSTGALLYLDGTTLKIEKVVVTSIGLFNDTNTTTVATGVTGGLHLELLRSPNSWYVMYDDKIVTPTMTTSDGFQILDNIKPQAGTDAFCSFANNRFVSFDIAYNELVYVTGDYDLPKILGIVKETVTAENNGKLQVNGGIDNSQSGLEIAMQYYVGVQGAITVHPTDTINGQLVTNRKLGMAMSTTKLLINI